MVFNEYPEHLTFVRIDRTAILIYRLIYDHYHHFWGFTTIQYAQVQIDFNFKQSDSAALQLFLCLQVISGICP